MKLKMKINSRQQGNYSYGTFEAVLIRFLYAHARTKPAPEC